MDKKSFAVYFEKKGKKNKFYKGIVNFLLNIS
jgi:hypothetical protein